MNGKCKTSEKGCLYCGSLDHWKNECPKLKKKMEQNANLVKGTQKEVVLAANDTQHIQLHMANAGRKPNFPTKKNA